MHMNDVFPLSFAQERLWILDRMEPGRTTYFIPIALRLRGLLDTAALERSLNEIVRRHEVLRTTITVVDGRPVQVIKLAVPHVLPVIDLRELAPADREAGALRLATHEAHHPFNLATESLARFQLVRLGEREHLFLLTMHHIISDGWSMGVFFHELATLYAAFTIGQPSPLPELPIQYADYAHWQHEVLESTVLDEQLAYWKERLAEVPAVLELPTDRPRPVVQGIRSATHSFIVSGGLAEYLMSLARREGVTLFMALLAAFQTLLLRYTGRDDIVVGTPIAGRTQVELEGLIGFFVNTLVLRTNLSGNPSFREILQRVRDVAIGAYAHQDVPFERLVAELQPERATSHTPLVQIMFVLQNTPTVTPKLADLSVQSLDIEHSTASFDLTLSFTPTPDHLMGVVEYNSDLFDTMTISRMVDHFQTLLAGAIAAPTQRIGSLPLLPTAERHQILDAWNATQTPYPQDRCIHELVEAQVTRSPDAVAVADEEVTITYAELNRRANRLAHHLQTLRVGPEVRVGLCMERSVEMIVGLLGVLKAGGVYVPLDPRYPQERLTFMQEDAHVAVLLTQRRLLKETPAHGVELLYVDDAGDYPLRQCNDNPCSGVTAANLAYVIYTSGSTGVPKGVMVPHRGLCNVIAARVRTLDTGPEDRLLQFVSFNFDVSIADVFTALVAGGTLCLSTSESLSPGPALIRSLYDRAITTMSLPASILAALPQAALPALRTVVVGGEPCPADLVARWGPGRRLFNEYGPTEATICATATECGESSRRPPIGRPIANTQIYLLDRHTQPVPVGVPGEVYIGGIGVARGYLNRPDLTAEQFIPHPFSTEPGGRLYKTGDVARYLPTGELEYLGRTDHQVKVRGFRIELGEIETVLSQHPAVQQAVALAQEDMAGHKQVVAYVTSRARQAPVPHDLRRFVQARLPDYMTPAAFVVMDALPVLPNGKVDRRALPTLDDVPRSMETHLEAPRTQIEEVLVGIWAQVLGQAQIGIHDNFFAIGGDSLRSIQVITRAQQAGLQLTPAHMFQHQTIAELAAVVIATA